MFEGIEFTINPHFIPNDLKPFIIFAPIPIKVLLKLSSILKSRKFDNGTKMIAVAPHHGYIPTQSLGLDIVLWCGLLFYPYQRQCESQRMR